ncbi:hypothetical protein OESDEN_09818 [Oesophagostomum dentatum]|uniref:SWIM-type domain-containing protein n=1 Tax=Oesophagostomum dentatum TaxID=61180 RepID=A0A0B1T4K4_OESDE|nr:hypothetical protein OESDEN_09818 [Oesophagostomum dentatum]
MVLCSCADAVKAGVSCKHAHAWALNHDGKIKGLISCTNPEYMHPSSESANVDDAWEPESNPSEEAVANPDDLDDVEEPSVPSSVFVSRRDERKELLVSINARLDRLSAAALNLSIHDNTEEKMRLLDNNIAQLENEFHDELGSTLVPRRNITTRGRCYGISQKDVLKKRFERLVQRSSRKSRRERLEYFCDSIDTDLQNVCAVCHEEEPPKQRSEAELEEEQSMIDWWCCEKCSIWMHQECLTTKRCPVCSQEIEPNESEFL